MKFLEKYPDLNFLIKNYVLPFLFLSTLFMFIAYIVVALRVSDAKNYIMPDITGKYFINIYNEISKYNLNIKLKRVYIPEKPSGIILQQSILPGEFIKPKDKLTLIINNYKPLLTMPRLVDLSLKNAREILSSISYDDETFSLEIKKILYVYRTDRTPDTVLYQYPTENTKVSLDEKVILIVSTNQPVTITIEELISLDVGSLSYYLANNQKTYLIKEILDTNHINEHGTINNIKFINNIYEISLKNYKKNYRFFSDFEFITLNPEKEETCEVYVSNSETNEIEKILEFDKIWFSKPHQFENEINLMINTKGETFVYLLCNNKIKKVKSFKPDFKI